MFRILQSCWVTQGNSLSRQRLPSNSFQFGGVIVARNLHIPINSMIEESQNPPIPINSGFGRAVVAFKSLSILGTAFRGILQIPINSGSVHHFRDLQIPINSGYSYSQISFKSLSILGIYHITSCFNKRNLPLLVRKLPP